MTDMNITAEQIIDDLIKSYDIVVFSKTFCPFCMEAKQILKEISSEGNKMKIVELDKDDLGSVTGAAMQDSLQILTKERTVPRIFIKGESYGGCSDLKRRKEEARKLLQGAQ